MARKAQRLEHGPKEFGIPANLSALHGYGGIIINEMHKEYRRRMEWARSHKFKVKGSK